MRLTQGNQGASIPPSNDSGSRSGAFALPSPKGLTMRRLAPIAITFATFAVVPLLGSCTTGENASVATSYTATAKARIVKAKAEPQIYLLRGGFAGVFSTGLDSIAGDLAKKKIPVKVQSWSVGTSIANRIKARYRQDPHSVGPVILGGHSLGAGSVLSMARELSDAGVTIDLLMVFDALGATPIPKNVKKFISFKASGNPDKDGSFTPAAGFRGKLVNVDIRHDAETAKANHFNIVNQKALQDRVAREIATAYRSWRPPRRARSS